MPEMTESQFLEIACLAMVAEAARLALEALDMLSAVQYPSIQEARDNLRAAFTTLDELAAKMEQAE